MDAGALECESRVSRPASATALWICALGIFQLMVDMAVGQLGTMDGFGLGAAPLPVAARQRIDAGIQMAGLLDLLACAALVAAGISEVLRKRVSIAAALRSPGLRLR